MEKHPLAHKAFDRPYQVFFLPGSGGHFISNLIYMMLHGNVEWGKLNNQVNEYDNIGEVDNSINCCHHEMIFLVDKADGHVDNWVFERTKSRAIDMIDILADKKVLFVDCFNCWPYIMGLARIKNNNKANRPVGWIEQFFNGYFDKTRPNIRKLPKRQENAIRHLKWGQNYYQRNHPCHVINYKRLFVELETDELINLYKFVTNRIPTSSEVELLMQEIHDYHWRNVLLVQKYIPQGSTINDMFAYKY